MPTPCVGVSKTPGGSPWLTSQATGVGASYCTRVLRLAFLSPEITTAILRGAQPADLTPRRLMNDTRLPLDWREQKSALGFI